VTILDLAVKDPAQLFTLVTDWSGHLLESLECMKTAARKPDFKAVTEANRKSIGEFYKDLPTDLGP
jgi:hypothetical protein